jgi:hypothetical protein
MGPGLGFWRRQQLLAAQVPRAAPLLLLAVAGLALATSAPGLVAMLPHLAGHVPR